MKIAYLCDVYPHTTHSFIRREIKGLEQHGMEVVRLTIRRSAEALPDQDDQDELKKTYSVLDRGFPAIIWNILAILASRPLSAIRAGIRALVLGSRSQRGVIRHLAYYAEACIVFRYLEGYNVDHLRAHFGTSAAMVALLVRELGGPPFSIMLHGQGEWDSPERLHIPEKVAAAEFVTVISDFAKSQTYRWTDPKQWGKIYLVRCGVDQKYLDHPIVPVPDVPNLVMIARLGSAKGHPILVKAIDQIVSDGIDVKVRLIGDGPFKKLIKEMIAERELEPYIELCGWKSGDSVRREILEARALLLPSFVEGLPIVIMEAFALARPVIGTQVGGVPELIKNGDNGWLVPPGNVGELAAACRQAMETPTATLTEMGLSGRKIVLEKHDALREAGKLAELLNAQHEPPAEAP